MSVTIDDCRQLKDEIEYLIQKGKCGRFTKGEYCGGQKREYDGRNNDQNRNSQLRGLVNMISGSLIATKTTKNSRDPYDRKVINIVREAPKQCQD